MFETPENFDDVAHQIITVYEKTLDKDTGLLFHAWNEDKSQEWADKETGHAPNIWGRAIGWYLMSIVDILDVLPEDHPNRTYIIEILKNVSRTLVNFRDSSSGLWYQLIDLGHKEGNYLESSCAAMFTYAFAKGANKNYLDKNYLEIAGAAFNSILKYHVTVEENGFVNLHHTCKGAGLGGNPYRDGSFEYYMSVPQATNDFKGYGPLIFAAVELEKAGLL
jgi:unsaturated rhamnogalacturonyl hydrolase